MIRITMILSAMVLAAGLARGDLIGGLVGETVDWGDDLIDNGEIDATEETFLLDGTDNRADWSLFYGGLNELSATFTGNPVNITEVKFRFQVGNTNHLVPTVDFHRDAARTDLVQSITGMAAPGNGFYERTMTPLNEDLSTLYFTFSRPSGSRNVPLLNEIYLTGTVVPEPGTLTLLLSGLALFLSRRYRK